jgi:hypothetical protein
MYRRLCKLQCGEKNDELIKFEGMRADFSYTIWGSDVEDEETQCE